MRQVLPNTEAGSHLATRKKRSKKLDLSLALPMFTAADLHNIGEAAEDANTLMAMFYFRKILDHQALSLCVQHFRPLSRFFEATERELKYIFARDRHLRGYVDAHQLVSHTQRSAASRYAERHLNAFAEGLGSLLMHNHPAFPRMRLERSRLPVDWLFIHPTTALRLSRPTVAIVGSRQSSKRQLDAARDVAEGVGALGGTVVTGLATGADGAAHEAARSTEASIVAVLGSGVAKPYPSEHAKWVKELLEGRGTVLSEVPPDYAPNQDGFVLRNRIVAALADVVVAVSGKYASGTAHTIRFACDASVPVVSVDPDPASGISALVRECGGYVSSPSDFVRQLERGEDA